MNLGALVGREDAVVEIETRQRELGQAVEVDGLLRAGAGDVAEMDVAELGRGLVDGHEIFLRALFHIRRGYARVIEIEDDGVGNDVLHGDVLAPDVLDKTATAAGALEAEADVGAEETAVADADVLDAAGHFAADDEAAVAMVDRAALDDEVAADFGMAAAVLVLAGLDADGVIAHVEGAAQDKFLAKHNEQFIFLQFIVKSSFKKILK